MIKLWTPDEVAEIMSVKEETVRSWLRNGYMRGVKIGKFWRIPEEDLKDFIEERLKEAELVSS